MASKNLLLQQRRHLTLERTPEIPALPDYQIPSMTTQSISHPIFTEPLSKRKRCAVPASWIRCGTSKGLFIDRKYLPGDQEMWKPFLTAVMGSNDTRQLDGIGGATSTTSKAAIVSRSSTPGIDVEYTFAQVAVGKEVVDFSGNCGNIASGVGPFAIDQGMIEVGFGQKQVDIRILNTNTNVVIIETLQVDEHGCFEETGTHEIAGIASPGSEIKVAFTNPAGSMTGQLFPTGCKNDRLVIDTEHGVFDIDVTMIDSGNPFAFVDASTLPLLPLGTLAEALPLELLELVRQKAAVKMGLAPNIEMASLVRGTPKIAMVFPSDQGPRLFHRSVANSTASDIAVVALSMGKMHPTLQLTGAVALSSALCVEGTVPFLLSSRARSQESSGNFRNEQLCCIEHAGGCIHIDVVSQSDGQRVHVEKCTLSRTARTLFEGLVMCHV